MELSFLVRSSTQTNSLAVWSPCPGSNERLEREAAPSEELWPPPGLVFPWGYCCHNERPWTCGHGRNWRLLCQFLTHMKLFNPFPPISPAPLCHCQHLPLLLACQFPWHVTLPTACIASPPWCEYVLWGGSLPQTFPEAQRNRPLESSQ